MLKINPDDITPIGWQGAAQHTFTTACAGHHGPGPCPGMAPGSLNAGDVVRLVGSGVLAEEITGPYLPSEVAGAW